MNRTIGSSWWRWVQTTTFFYIATVVVGAMFFGTQDGVIVGGILLPFLALIIGFFHRALSLSLKNILYLLLSSIGILLRFYFFPESWYRDLWVVAGSLAWLIYIIVALEGSAREPQPSLKSFVAVALPLVPTAVIIYYVFLR